MELSEQQQQQPNLAAAVIETEETCSAEVFYHPETGERISKNAYKKLLKGLPVKKEKREKVSAPSAVVASTEKKDKKEKKAKEGKEAEAVCEDRTPEGQCKDIAAVFPAAYQPRYVEAAWQSWWEKSKFYEPNVEKAKLAGEEGRFVMVIPPPNVTGSLHLGHALTNAIQDTLTRWHRMSGKVTLWVPGVDHAGIATQSVVEKRLKKMEGLSRHDLGREEFIKRVWQWKEQYGNRICNQIRSLGASVDWSREAFTMDSNLSTAVTAAFVRFHADGLLYRDTRLVNWSCALKSAISDIEVDHRDLEGRDFLSIPNHTLQPRYEFGVITSFAYKVVPEDAKCDGEEIVVATTRLETMLGDSAVAVHPLDPRYTHLLGKHLVHPFLPGKRIPVIADGDLVDMSFGTGAVKVTPAHDPNDYLCGKRHQLEFTIVLTEDGRIASNGGPFAGMMRYDARVAIEKALQELGLFRGKEPNKMRLGICSRSGDVIEPMLTPQWYVDCSSMARRSVEAVRSGQLKILPEMHESTWYGWLDNIRDWCISRQLWWGHRIPAYFVRLPGETAASMDQNAPDNNHRWFVGHSESEARSKAAAALHVSAADLHLSQDEDVLDTWFSSGLFPFSVFGWPNDTDDMKAFFPTSLLETGLDILFFWVARMVMMSLHLTDQLPFRTIYLHAMVRDKNGKKMSKSLGNVIDPMEVIHGCSLNDLLTKIDEGNLPEKEVLKAKAAQTADFPDGIPECGADALRFGLLAYTVQGRDVNLDIKRVVGYRQFCNKIWNAFKFALTYLTTAGFDPSTVDPHLILQNPHVQPRDEWILSRLNSTIEETGSALQSYLFGVATSALHQFFLYDLCDVYLELVKPVFTNAAADNQGRVRITQAVLYTVMEVYLRLSHPFMPYLTEELYQRLALALHTRTAASPAESIMISSYPQPCPEWSSSAAESRMTLLKSVVNGARSVRTEYKVPNHVKADFYYSCSDADTRSAVALQAEDFCTLAKGSCLRALDPSDGVPPGCCIKVVSENLSLLVDLTGVIDADVETQRLQKERERLLPLIESYRRKMGAADYESKVPDAVRVTNSEKVAGYEAELEATLKALSIFEAMK